MFILRGFNGILKYEKLHRSKYMNIRFKSTENLVKGKDHEPKDSRRFVKPVETKEPKLLKDDFFRNLFSGTIDREIFNYPKTLRDSDIHIVLNHSTEVENFLKENSGVKVTEEIIEKLRKLELFGLSVPQKYGGAGYSETESTFLLECTGTNPTIGRFLGYNENFGCKILSLYGTEKQKEKYLPRLAQGKSFISFAYLENGPIIDLSKIEGFAIMDEVKNHFILKAEKKWVHDADKADLFLVMVKVATFNEEVAEVHLKLNFFLVERNTPGLTIHKVKSEYAQENNLYDISLNEVVVPGENIVGGLDINGYQVLRTALACNNVTEAALCCNLLKKITHEALWFIKEKKLMDKSVTGFSFYEDNLAFLVLYVFAVESVIYLITGRYDTYNNPDLFNESVFAKILTIDFLQMAINRYTELLGRESFQSSEILEEAIKAVQYYSVFEENINYFKMMSAAEGLVQTGNKFSHKIKILRNPHEYSWERLKKFYTLGRKALDEIKQKQNFKLELQEALKYAGDSLDETFTLFHKGIEEIFVSSGASIMDSEHIIATFGEMAAYIYASIACLSRASCSLCYDFNDCKNEAMLAQAFSQFALLKVKEFYNEEIFFRNSMMYYKDLGGETLARKEYPVEHPLARTF